MKKKKDNDLRKKIDLVIKIVLIIIIIILLIHNCVLRKEKDKYQNSPNGNVDIIDIKCDDSNKCKPIPTPENTSKTSDGKKPVIKTITSLSFTQENYSVRKGSKLQLVPIVNPSSLAGSKFTWKSSNPLVVMVDENGVITGLKEGTAIVTVISSNGKVASCVINVTNDTVNIDNIVLDPNKTTLKVGDTSQIVATIEPDNATERNLTWSSSDSSIVSVDSKGVITGLKPGKVIITVKSKDGKVVATSEVTVEAIDVKEITLNPTNMSLNVGTSSSIVAVVKPENATYKTITWTSSDPSIATVDSTGKVTGLKPGTVTITATSSDGKVKTTCTVTVTTDVIEVENIILNPTDITITKNESEQIIATIEPTNATERELTWISSDPSIATVDSTGKVTGVKVGTVTITAQTKDGKVKATVNVTVENELIDNEVNVFDDEKDPIEWNGSSDLQIFTKSIYNVDGFLAPESQNTYQFIVRNDTSYRIKYGIKFNETNNFDINMKYKLKKNDTYLISEYSKANALTVTEFYLDPGESDTYYLEWRWISSSNDTSIGTNPAANYSLQIDVEAESV